MKNAFKSKKLLAGLAIVVVLATGGGLLAWNRSNTHENNIKKQTAIVAQAAFEAKQKEHITYKGVDGKNALSLLQASHKVEIKTYSFGEQVVSIDGLAGNGPKYWTFYTNGKMSDVGAGDFQSKSSDIIEWKLEQL